MIWWNGEAEETRGLGQGANIDCGPHFLKTYGLHFENAIIEFGETEKQRMGQGGMTQGPILTNQPLNKPSTASEAKGCTAAAANPEGFNCFIVYPHLRVILTRVDVWRNQCNRRHVKLLSAV